MPERSLRGCAAYACGDNDQDSGRREGVIYIKKCSNDPGGSKEMRVLLDETILLGSGDEKETQGGKALCLVIF